MNVAKVIAIAQVEDELADAEEFYKAQAFGIGTHFRDSLVADMESLELYAGTHSKHVGYYRMLAKRFPYAIYYDIEKEVARVVAVLDMRRNSAGIKRKLRGRDRGDSQG
jgi:plasmid stabilization system protein ParE